AGVFECDVFFEHSAARAENQLDVPSHAVDAVRVAHGNRGAAVRMAGVREIDRRYRGPVVADREIEFDSKRGPRAAQTDERLLNGGIGVEHRLAADLVDASVDVAAQIRKDG